MHPAPGAARSGEHNCKGRDPHPQQPGAEEEEAEQPEGEEEAAGTIEKEQAAETAPKAARNGARSTSNRRRGMSRQRVENAAGKCAHKRR